ncbi:MAG TPA: DUF4390 domain-containing protein [Gammaproteobacteria bacterium]|nr:DUF4390 domain-containing protein [Gammaproteobacteria bacterium]
MIRRKAVKMAVMLCLPLAWQIALPATARAEPGIVVEAASARVEHDIYLVDARLRYELSEEARQALESGIPLTFTVEVEFRERRSYLWDPVVADSRHFLRLEYHVLSRSYLVSDLTIKTRQSFPQLQEALDALGTIHNMAVVERNLLDPNASYQARLSARLEIESLPAPLRPAAYFQSAWRIKSPVHQWALTP